MIIDLFRKDKDSFRQTVAFAILTFDEMIDKTQFKVIFVFDELNKFINFNKFFRNSTHVS